MSSISGSVQWSTPPDIDVFHLRGRLLNSGLPMYVATVSAMTSEASRTSSSRTPASGQFSMPRAAAREVQHPAGGVAAGLGLVEADLLEPAPDLGDVLDADPVVLDVLPVGDVGDVPAALGADLPDHPQLVAGERAAVGAHPHHEVRVLELLGLEDGGLAARDALG